MYIGRKWLFLNVFALTVNALFFWLAVFKTVPLLLPIATFALVLAGLIALSFKINQQANQHRPS